MTRTTLIVALIVLIAGGTVVQATAQESKKQPTSSLESEVKGLVADLGRADFQTRERANKRLTELGAKATPFLKAYRNHQDIEVRTRVRALLEGDQEGPTPLRKIDPDEAQSTPKKLRRRSLKKRARNPLEDLLNRESGSTRFRFNFPTTDWGGTGQRSFMSMTSMQVGNESLKFEHRDDSVRLTVKPRNGSVGEKVFEAKTMEEFKKAYPDEFNKYKGSGIFENALADFQVLAPRVIPPNGGRRQGVNDPMDGNLKRLFEILERDLSGRNLGGGAFGSLDGDLDKRLRAFFERTKNGPSTLDFDSLFRPRRPLRSIAPGPKKKVLGVEVSLPPASMGVDLEKSGVGDKGIYVEDVTLNSLASQIGLKAGDILLSLNGDEISKPADLKTSFLLTKPNGKLSFAIWRGGKLLTLTGSMPGPPKKTKKLRHLPDVKKL